MTCSASPEGATIMFKRAGFRVLHKQIIGDERITTGVDMGFGTRDFPRSYLAARLRGGWSGANASTRSTQFINCAMVLVRNATLDLGLGAGATAERVTV